MTFDLGSFALGIVLALSLCWIVMYIIYRSDKKGQDEILEEYRRVLDATKKE